MKTKGLILFALLLTLGGATACASSLNKEGNSQGSITKPSRTPIQNNLVALFLVKKDNLKNEFRGEIYPIALYTNGKYIDASTDLTAQVRDKFSEEILVRNNQQKTPLSAYKTFTAIDGTKTLGAFNVDKLGVSQFACSSYLVGRGQFESQPSLPTLFSSIPSDRAGGLSGFIAGKEIDEAWRWTIAVSQHASPAALVQGDEAIHKRDLLAAAKSLVTQSAKPRAVGETVVERVSVFDLDRDGRPEVFGTVRQGADPKTLSQAQTGRPGNPTLYVNLWLSYKTNQPVVIASELQPYEIPVSRSPYDVAGVSDLNGDGIDEVLVRNIGYESTSFSIYEFSGDRLRQVFEGAGYGC